MEGKSRVAAQHDRIAALQFERYRSSGPFRFTDAEQAVGVAERVRRTLASPFVVSGNRINIAGSIGVVYMETSVDLEDALACSDRASYLAKRSGGDQVSLCSPGSKEG